MSTTEKVKQIASNYYKPTPSKWRKIGDAIQDASIILGCAAAFTTAPWIPVAVVILGRIGKIITNFATE